MKVVATPERQEERGLPPVPVEGTPAQAIARVETTVPSTTSEPSTALVPHTTIHSPSATILRQEADSTRSPETPNRGG